MLKFNLQEEASECVLWLFDYLKCQDRPTMQAIDLADKKLNEFKKEFLGFFYIFPLFFVEPYYADINLCKLRRFVAWNALFVKYVRLNDDVEDGDNPLSQKSTQAKIYKRLSSEIISELFGENSDFGYYYKRYEKQQDDALQKQKDYNHTNIRKLKLDFYIDLSIMKGAMAKLVPLGVCLLVDDFFSYKNYSKSVDHFNVAYQAIDDFIDWKEDFEAHRPNLFASLLEKQMNGKNHIILTENDHMDKVLINCFTEISEFSKEHYLTALKLTHGLGLNEWEKLIRLQSDNANRMMNLC